ncbi:hypothetical protein Mal65_27090 [Crateriforma conspicua]|nr:hypothetical protein Mal65_27090 [Crateriforma conspicua]
MIQWGGSLKSFESRLNRKLTGDLRRSIEHIGQSESSITQTQPENGLIESRGNDRIGDYSRSVGSQQLLKFVDGQRMLGIVRQVVPFVRIAGVVVQFQ